MLFSNKALRKLLVPLILEQLLAGLMGIADTLMVSRVGESAISAVACADAVNTLMVYILIALAAGGTIVCSQYLGMNSVGTAKRAAGQVLLLSLVISLTATALFVSLRAPVFRLIFGKVEPDVMSQALDYFLITVFSYPFLGIGQTCTALFRAEGDTKLPMLVNALSNCLNIAGNALLIFRFDMGVTGAAISTLVSRIIAAVVLLFLLRRPDRTLYIRKLSQLRPDAPLLRAVIRVGVPSGVENGMFQFGRLIVQSTVSTLGTTATAAQALIGMLDMMSSIPGMAVGLAALTVIGRCIGAGEAQQARYYTRKLCIISEISAIVMSVLILLATRPATRIAGMTPEAAELTFRMVLYIGIAKALLWCLAFTLPNTLRAAGDVTYPSVVSSISMWVFRVALSALLCRVLGVGLIGVWIAWFTDWVCRVICFVTRYRSGKWLGHGLEKPVE